MSLMSKTIRKLAPLGGYALARQLCRREPRILMYHRFSDPPVKDWASPACFEEQIKHICKRYRPFSLSGLIQYSECYGQMPEHAVVITVDDGYRDFYEYAYPILHKYDVPATLFATTGFVDGRLWLWPDKVSWLLKNARQVTDNAVFGTVMLQAGQSCEHLSEEYWQLLISHGLSMPDHEKHAFIDDLASVLGLELPGTIPDEFAPVSWEQLRELEEGGIEIGGHTVTHPTLGQVTEAQAREEIFGCREELVEQLGNKPRTFCYPNGQPSDFQDFLLPLVEQAGFLGAVTAFPDGNGTKERFAMRRHVGGDDMFQFNKAISGVEYLGHRIRGNIQNL